MRSTMKLHAVSHRALMNAKCCVVCWSCVMPGRRWRSQIAIIDRFGSFARVVNASHQALLRTPEVTARL